MLTVYFWKGFQKRAEEELEDNEQDARPLKRSVSGQEPRLDAYTVESDRDRFVWQR